MRESLPFCCARRLRLWPKLKCVQYSPISRNRSRQLSKRPSMSRTLLADSQVRSIYPPPPPPHFCAIAATNGVMMATATRIAKSSRLFILRSFLCVLYSTLVSDRKGSILSLTSGSRTASGKCSTPAFFGIELCFEQSQAIPVTLPSIANPEERGRFRWRAEVIRLIQFLANRLDKTVAAIDAIHGR